MNSKESLCFAILLLIIGTVVIVTGLCPYDETVDITNATKFDNGSYLYQGVLLKPNEVAEYSYVIHFKDQREETAKHLRGCVCLHRKCINVCCDFNGPYDDIPKKCFTNPPVANISINGTIVEKPINEVFFLQPMKSISKVVGLNSAIGFPFVIYMNNSSVQFDEQSHSKNEFCLTEDDGDEGVMVQLIQVDLFYTNINNAIVYANLFSVPFMILTICVYVYIKELRNNYTKAFICYLIGLSVGYVAISLKFIAPAVTEMGAVCKASGYISYYFFMLAFFAMNAISYDIWSNFRGTRRYEDDKKFIIYASYIFGGPLILFIITLLCQELDFLEASVKPGFHQDTSCWLNQTSQWPAIIFFFGPMLLLVVANIIMFSLTARKILNLQKKYQTSLATNSNANPVRNLHSEKVRFSLFLRLGILMGVLWIFELANFFSGQSELNAKIFFISDILNALQGLIIFVLFVLRKPVRRALLSKMCNKDYADSASEGSYTTNADVRQGPAAAQLMNLRETEEE